MEQGILSNLRKNLEVSTVRFKELQNEIADPALFKDQKRTKELMQEHNNLSPIINGYQRLRELDIKIVETKELFEESDGEMAELAKEELKELENEL